MLDTLALFEWQWQCDMQQGKTCKTLDHLTVARALVVRHMGYLDSNLLVLRFGATLRLLACRCQHSVESSLPVPRVELERLASPLVALACIDLGNDSCILRPTLLNGLRHDPVKGALPVAVVLLVRRTGCFDRNLLVRRVGRTSVLAQTAEVAARIGDGLEAHCTESNEE